MLGKHPVKKDNEKRTLRLASECQDFSYMEAFKTLRNNLDYVLKSQNAQQEDTQEGYLIAVTSSIPKEGKTNVAINLAQTLAGSGKKVLLMDCDLRKGTLKSYLKPVGVNLGLSSYLLKGTRKSPTIGDIIRPQTMLGFDVIFSGNVTDNPISMFESQAFASLLSTLRSSYDYIICDTTPVNAVSDILVLSQMMDGILYVVSHGRVKKNEVRAAKKQLETVNATILGIVFNMYDQKKASDDSYYYTYQKYEYYGAH